MYKLVSILLAFVVLPAFGQDYNVPFVPRAAAGTPEDLNINEVVSTVNMVAANCTVARLDEGATPAGDWCTADTNGASELYVGFPTPVTAPTAGAGLQTCRFHIRRNSGGGNAVDWQINVYDGGTLIQSAIATGSTTSTGETVTGTWNASNLITPSGANAQCGILQTGGHSGNPSNRRFLEVDTGQWNEQ